MEEFFRRLEVGLMKDIPLLNRSGIVETRFLRKRSWLDNSHRGHWYVHELGDWTKSWILSLGNWP